MKKKLTLATSTILMSTLLLSFGSGQVDAAKENKQVANMLDELTIEQKVGQMLQPDTRSVKPKDIEENFIGSILSGGGASPEGGNTAKDWADRLDQYQKAAVEGIGIPLLYGVDAVHGHNNVSNATIFPHNIGLGQANDETLMEKIGAATAVEMRATGAHWTFTPTLGLPKNERWGRAYECFGESADLTARLGAAYIKGSQGSLGEENAIATAKHFIGEGITKDGVNQGDVPLAFDSEEFQKVLHDELLVPYKSAIAADVKTVMVTYNSINGEKSHGNKPLLTDLLKDELGFAGFVISDYNGVDQIEGDLSYKDKVIKGVNAGIDMVMVDGYEGSTPKWQLVRQAILEGVKENKITEERIDDAVERILTVKSDMGLLDADSQGAFANRALLETVGGKEHRQLAREAVQSSLTLLKNSKTKSGTVMSDLKDMKKIVVAGSSANDIGMQAGGWTISWQGSKGNITEGTTILDGLKEVASEGTTIDYSRTGTLEATDYEAAILVMGEEPYAEYAGDAAAADLKLSASDASLVKKIKKEQPGLPIIAVLTTGRPITIVNQLEDLDVIVMAGLPGTEGAGIADVLLGEQDFTGKLTMTWPWYAQDIEQKFSDDSKVLFEAGRGLTKKQTTALKNEAPEDPTLIDLKETAGIIEAENFVEKHPDIVLENNQTSIGHFWEDRHVTYNVKVPDKARYTMSLHTATGTNNTTLAFDVYVDNKLYYQASQPLANSGDWANFSELELSEKISLPNGAHEIKFVSRSRNFNVDYFKLVKFDDQYEEPLEEGAEPESNGAGSVIKEGAVNVSMSSSENSQSMSWYTTPQEIKNKNAEKNELTLRNLDDSDLTSIVIDADKEQQNVLGLGISLEESTINNMLKMSDSKRKAFIYQLIDPVNGMGNTLIRLTIGTSDFTGQDFYTYYDGTGTELDGQPDWENETGKGFSVQKDKDVGIIKIVKEVQEVAKELGVEDEMRFFASSWTPPGWMKTPTNASNSYPNNELLLKGGRLNDDHIQDLAKYYVRYVEEYAKEGIPIYAMTLQNEPLLEINYPSCYITGSQEAKMSKAIKDELAASSTLSASAKDVKVWAFDHNFDGAENYVNDLFETADGRDNVDGLAFHPYGGVPSTMGSLYEKYKDDYTMHLTERSVWGTSGANDIIEWFRNGSESYNGWVTMLDSNIAPHQWVGTPDPTLFVQDASSRDTYWSTPEVYIIGQFSKYIRPGYVRINSTNGGQSTVTNVAFKDPKTGRIVLVVTNRSKKHQEFKVVLDGTQFNAVLPAGNTATYMWDPVDTAGVKALTDEWLITDPTLTGSGEIKDEQTLEKIDQTTKLDYYTNVKESGKYKVEFEVAAGGDSTKNLPIELSQEGEVLGEAHVMPHITWNEEEAWSTYTKVQTYVTFEKEGLQNFSLTFPEGGMNFKKIQFTKEAADQSLPGALTTTNYFDQKGLVVEPEDTPNFGYISRDDYVDYKVLVQKSATYDIFFDVATTTTNSGVWIDTIDAEGTVSNVGDFDFANTEELTTYKRQAFSMALTEGKQTLRIKFKAGETNLRQVIIGNGIKVSQPVLTEGALDGTSFTLDLLTGKFAALDPTKWELPLPEGVTYKLERVSDTRVKVVLTGEAENDFDQDLTIGLTIDAAQVGGIAETVLKEKILITAIDDEEELIVPNEVAFGTEKVEIGIEGGTFNQEVADHISLSDTITSYVTITEVERVSKKKVILSLKWNAMYGDTKATVKITSGGYSAGSAALLGEITFKSTDKLPDPIVVEDQPVTLAESLAYRHNGSLKDSPQQGNYLDYYLGVEEEGDYLISYQVKNNQAVGNALKLSGGKGLATDNLASISFPNLWNNTLEYRNTLHLQAGDQTLRFEMNAPGYQLLEIKIQKLGDPITIEKKTTLDTNQIIDGSKDKGWIIEEKSKIKNIGSTTAGAYVDYPVTVETAGTYQFMVSAGGDVSNGKAVLQTVKNGKAEELGLVDVANTKDWGKFADSKSVEVVLEKGEQTLRIFFKDAGFNYRHTTLTFVRAGGDKAELEALIATIERLNDADYTTPSWHALVEALTAAKTVIADEAAQQPAIDTAVTSLTTAKEALVKRGDKAALIALVNEIKGLDEAAYTSESWSQLAAVLVEAEAIVADEDATQATIDSGLEALTVAQENLVPQGSIEPDTISLNITGLKSLKKGKDLQLVTTISPVEAVTGLTWIIAKEDIASVNAEGVLHGLKVGTTKVTVRTSNGKVASFTLRVTN